MNFELGGRYYVESNEKLLERITECENKMMLQGVHCPTDFYVEIYEK